MTDQPNLSLTIEDLQVMARIIAAGSQRGTFRAEEMATAGILFNKTVAILEGAGKVPADMQAAPEASPEEAPAEEAEAE